MFACLISSMHACEAPFDKAAFQAAMAKPEKSYKCSWNFFKRNMFWSSAPSVLSLAWVCDTANHVMNPARFYCYWSFVSSCALEFAWTFDFRRDSQFMVGWICTLHCRIIKHKSLTDAEKTEEYLLHILFSWIQFIKWGATSLHCNSAVGWPSFSWTGGISWHGYCSNTGKLGHEVFW